MEGARECFYVSGCARESVSGDGGVEIKKYDPGVVARGNAIVYEGMQKGSIPGALVCVWNEGYETLLVARGMADIASGRAPRKNIILDTSIS